jgi:four helix bundle protein
VIARRYEDLVCWQLARELERRVFAFTATMPAAKDFEYCEQIRSSSSSGARNLAEGFGRFWPGENARLVRIARASLMETRDHLGAGRERGYMTASEHHELNVLANRAIGATTRYAVYLESAAERWKEAKKKVPGSRFRVPGSNVPGSKVRGSKVRGSKVRGSKVPGSKVPGSQVPRSECSPQKRSAKKSYNPE